MKNKSFEELTLEEILYLNDKNMYNQYMNELGNFSTNRISRKIISTMRGSPLADIYAEIFREEELCKSMDFFKGDLVRLYSSIKEQKSKQFITCDFSGAPIYPCTRYAAYRPILENISKNEVYVLKTTLKVECGYIYSLPSNIQELETLQKNINLGQDLSDGIDYSHLSQRVGGELALKKLKKKGR